MRSPLSLLFSSLSSPSSLSRSSWDLSGTSEGKPRKGPCPGSRELHPEQLRVQGAHPPSHPLPVPDETAFPQVLPTCDTTEDLQQHPTAATPSQPQRIYSGIPPRPPRHSHRGRAVGSHHGHPVTATGSAAASHHGLTITATEDLQRDPTTATPSQLQRTCSSIPPRPPH